MLLHNDSEATKLEREWLGPYTAVRKISETNYEISYNTHKYTVHANRLKPYYQ